MKNLYEGMFILSAQLSAEARGKALERITAQMTKENGEIHKVHEMGRKKLAYEIRRHREGYYFLIYFDLPSDAVIKLTQEYHLNEDLLRFMIVRTDEVKETLEFKSLVKVRS